MEEKKLGLKSVISVSVGLVIATSCLVSLGQGAGTIGIAFIPAMIIACLLNMTTIASLSELNALMPNTTGGLAQYTLACLGPFPTMISMVGGYLFCNILSCGVEASIFAYA
ncbi:MAG: APC family permease, partial [Lachnospiraceae bacterium]|nr:APC family permease [Lachnospiraceae bacterium]